MGESVTVRVRDSQEETASLLLEVLNDNSAAANLLSKAVHSRPTIEIPDLDIPDDFEIILEEIGIWIDPIDATQEYISGGFEEDALSLRTSGLYCVTCLIGVYSLISGQSLIGVINQPFCKRNAELKFEGRFFWGFDFNDFRMSNLEVVEESSSPLKVVVSESESKQVLDQLNLANLTVIKATGAGFKLLCAINGWADIFVTSKSSTYKWDTCAPHALLKATGGNLINLTESRKAPKEGINKELIAQNEIKYNVTDEESEGVAKFANKTGLIAFRVFSQFEKVLNVLNE